MKNSTVGIISAVIGSACCVASYIAGYYIGKKREKKIIHSKELKGKMQCFVDEENNLYINHVLNTANVSVATGDYITFQVEVININSESYSNRPLYSNSPRYAQYGNNDSQ